MGTTVYLKTRGKVGRFEAQNADLSHAGHGIAGQRATDNDLLNATFEDAGEVWVGEEKLSNVGACKRRNRGGGDKGRGARQRKGNPTPSPNC